MPTLSLSPADASKLAKLCGMFSSDYDGERANAAQMADNLLKKTGLTWEQMFQGAKLDDEPSHRSSASYPDYGAYSRAQEDCRASRRKWAQYDYRLMATCCLHHPEVLFEGEERFLKNLLRQSSISPRQRDWLTKIAIRCEFNVRPNG